VCEQQRKKNGVGNIENLDEMCSTMDMCYKRPEKYIAEALRLITELRKYKVSDSAIRDFYSPLRVASWEPKQRLN
jgi:hypothetical protein